MFVELSAVRIHYKQEGSGVPLLLLHGNSENFTIFDPLTEKLKDHYSVYAIDSRNHGKSGKTEEISYESMAGDMYEFIVKLGLGKVYVAGFSDGAITAWIMAMKHPEVLGKMILMGPNTNPGDLTDEAVELIKRVIPNHDTPEFRMIFEQPQLEIADLAKITIPSLLIFGENDLFKPEMIEKLKVSLQNCQLKVLPGHDHLSYVVENDLLYPDFKAFLG
ncbi:MAG: alpha/beta hydrolase, partial [Deltaproteobacteria bacterium]|jgi:pimeloyl-ACP methyl ester carboxylesterase|nr:alpha/beta hydrolase [Deltaproteobacteria bacterium]